MQKLDGKIRKKREADDALRSRRLDILNKNVLLAEDAHEKRRYAEYEKDQKAIQKRQQRTFMEREKDELARRRLQLSKNKLAKEEQKFQFDQQNDKSGSDVDEDFIKTMEVILAEPNTNVVQDNMEVGEAHCIIKFYISC